MVATERLCKRKSRYDRFLCNRYVSFRLSFCSSSVYTYIKIFERTFTRKMRREDHSCALRLVWPRRNITCYLPSGKSFTKHLDEGKTDYIVLDSSVKCSFRSRRPKRHRIPSTIPTRPSPLWGSTVSHLFNFCQCPYSFIQSSLCHLVVSVFQNSYLDP